MFLIPQIVYVAIIILILLSHLLPQLSMMGGPRLILQPFDEAVQLHKAQNAWRPSARRVAEGSRDRGEEVPEKATTEVLFRTMRSILNKLTPEVFPLLVKQVSELNIDTEERLRGITSIIFEKAISEVKFSRIYAQLCHRLREVSAQTVPSQCIRHLFLCYVCMLQLWSNVLQTTGRMKCILFVFVSICSFFWLSVRQIREF